MGQGYCSNREPPSHHCWLALVIDLDVQGNRGRLRSAFVQIQVGHSYASTTGLYSSASSDFMQKTVQKMIANRFVTLEDQDA